MPIEPQEIIHHGEWRAETKRGHALSLFGIPVWHFRKSVKYLITEGVNDQAKVMASYYITRKVM